MDQREDWDRFVEHFNAGRYLECVAPLEEIWFVERDDFHKGLIRVCVALHQLRLGLLTSPRFLLSTAHELLAPFEPVHRQVQVEEVRAFIRQSLACIPEDAETGSGVEIDLAALPQLKLSASDGNF